jgi:DDE superfamily endonuclease
MIRVRGVGSGRVSIAGLACYRPGQRPRLFYRTRRHHGRKGEPKGLTWRDYRDLICAAHRELGRPIVLVWDNLPTHRCAQLAAFAAENELWLTVVQLPSYTPDLNPVESVWSLLKRGRLANLALTGVDHLTAVVRSGLGRIQRNPDLLDGCLAATGLTLEAS